MCTFALLEYVKFLKYILKIVISHLQYLRAPLEGRAPQFDPKLLDVPFLLTDCGELLEVQAGAGLAQQVQPVVEQLGAGHRVQVLQVLHGDLRLHVHDAQDERRVLHLDRETRERRMKPDDVMHENVQMYTHTYIYIYIYIYI